MFLLTLLPYLSTVPPPHRSATADDAAPSAPAKRHTTRAIDCGAGVGRVTADVLLPLFDRVDLVEPVPTFLSAAAKAAPTWRGIADGDKGVRLWQKGLQDFDPAKPEGAFGEVFGAKDDWDPTQGYDVVWIQCAHLPSLRSA
jgi:protein N-terminal methyltransferase